MTITIVGLGPGDPQKLTLEAWKALQDAAHVLLWSEGHIAIADLPRGPEYRLLADECGEGGDWRTCIVEAVCAYDDVVYAVPGDPFILELTDAIVERAAALGKSVRTVSGVNFVGSALAALGIVAGDGLQIHNAEAIAGRHFPPLNPAAPALLAMLHSVDVANRLREVLLRQYPGDHPVSLINSAGTDQQSTEAATVQTFPDCPSIGPRTTLYLPALSSLCSFESLQETMSHLRAPEGCPWDREQTHETLRPYVIEESYEVVEAINSGDSQALCEELGDVLLQVAFHTQIAIEEGRFRMTDVLSAINSKMIRRHPHVWGDASVSGSGDVVQNWEAIKKQERKGGGNGRTSLLDGVPRTLPALSQSFTYQERAARVGFDWDGIEDVISKVTEEIDEIMTADDPARRTAEIGDLLFALVNWIRWMDVDPEMALRDANGRFYRRFRYIEEAVDRIGRAMTEMTLQELDALWEEAKRNGL